MAAHVKVVAGDAAAYMELVDRSNEATRLVKANKLSEAETLLRDVLRRKPAAGFDAVSVALTQHELGSVLRQRGRLDEALELLAAALEVRDRADEAAGIGIALRDGMFEAMGDCERALQVRDPSRRICANDACEALDYEKVQACGRCKCVFYCCKTCQKQDWKSRHHALCRPPKKAP
ncbi:hypothetical protein PF005_g2829 [Phytophthora fragariae]|uniref:phytol kinase n=1 Tax=Phytophthora fragariae TaxID=53985 RepID=A0A6A3ZB15_9STRA|nr:hypothetical protein PF003_g27209 [Phytophthora fragariae]KAE8947362.1 hypothetical protein PF009_g3015 [Phytophthora fragariae]KAE9027166.1 hypothetical protein PF011_g2164 [Phytophthora fragariae]KAE9134793.1 hypothetical protein PF007_g2784 [Phytophthora fragariae]KAE9135084.1 hypothetical protein PF010_g2206 [Phytophthora fragariae]